MIFCPILSGAKTLATAQHPNGYYPTCADLIEVTAHIATPAEGRTDLTNPWAAENLCGPFQIRFYLDPKPKVEFTSEPTKNIVNQKYTATANLQVKTPPMMGTIAGAAYTWQRQVWRSLPNTNPIQYTPPTIGSADDWSDITLTNPLTPDGDIRSGGTYSEGNFNRSDSIRIRCIMNLTDVPVTNTLLDRACTTVISEPVYVTMPKPQPTLLAASAPKLGETASITASAQEPDGMQSKAPASPARGSQPFTVDLLTAPNPAETHVGLRFSLPDEAQTTVEVLDALQRVVLVPMKEQSVQYGEQSITISIETLPSGVYSVRLTARLANNMTLIERRTLIIAR